MTKIFTGSADELARDGGSADGIDVAAAGLEFNDEL